MIDFQKNLVSVIITTRNRPELLRSAIKSVLNQTYESIEIFVVDDCSSTNTKAVVESYFDRVTFIQHDRRLGTAAARMSGARRAKGNYIAFLDDDDMWRSNKIEKQLRIAETSGNNCAVVTCGAIIYNDNKEIYSYPTLEGLIREGIFKSGFKTIPSNHFFNKKIFDRIGGYDSSLLAHEEHDIWMKLAKANYETRVVKEPLVIIHEYDRVRKMTDVSIRISAFEMFYNKWKSYVFKWYGKSKAKRILNNYMVSIYLMNASLMEEVGDRRGARLFSRKVPKYVFLLSLNSQTLKLFYRMSYYFLPVPVTNFHKNLKSKYSKLKFERSSQIG